MTRRPGRLLLLVVSLAVLAGLVVWLTRPKLLAAVDEGEALRILGRAGQADLLVERSEGSWSWRQAGGFDGATNWFELASIPGLALVDRPLLDAQGGVWLLEAARVGRLDEQGQIAWTPLPLEAAGEVSLAGIDSDGGPLLRERHSDGDRLFVRHAELGWSLLAGSGDRARLPGASTVLVAPTRRALAFRGDEGWEVWLYGETSATRLIARRRFGDAAVFTPDGKALIVDGILDGLDRLELDQERMRFMAEGNFGTAPGVPFSAVFRGDPPLLVASRRDLQGWLQIYQAHVGGGGGYQFTTGSLHHYLPAVTPSGVWLAYAQARSSPEGDDGFREDLYLFDFSRPNDPALALGARTGGITDQGPLFLSDDLDIAWVADGRLQVGRLPPVHQPPE